MASPDTQALLSLYHETWEEITRLRNTEWRIAYTVWTLGGALLALLTIDDVQKLLSFGVRIYLTFVEAAIGLLGLIYLEFTHQYLTQQRNIRRNIEEVLRFHAAYQRLGGEASILPAEWKGKRITHWFQRLGLVVPLAFAIVVVQVSVIYVIWTIAECEGACSSLSSVVALA